MLLLIIILLMIIIIRTKKFTFVLKVHCSIKEVKVVCLKDENLFLTAISFNDRRTLVLYGVASGWQFSQAMHSSSISIAVL